MNQIQEWNYAHDADITFGEVHTSKAPKIILIVIVAFIVIACTLSIIFRNYIFDYIVNPQLELKNDFKYNNDSFATTIEYNSEFDPETFIDNISDKYSYTIENNVDSSTIGDYKVIYKSSNRVFDKEQVLIVHVVDSTAPIIELNAQKDSSNRYYLSVIRGKDDKTFDAEEYIKSVKDNYTPKNKLKINYTKDIDFSKDNFTIVYSVEDEFGNIGTTSLSLIIKDDMNAINEELDELKKKEEELKKLQEEEQRRREEEERRKEEEKTKTTTTQKPVTDSQDKTSSSQQSAQEPVQSTTTTTITTHSPKPSIYANPVTISISAGSDKILAECVRNVFYENGSGYAQPYGMPGYDFQLEVGTFTVTWTTTDGLSCTQVVTITE